MQKILNYIDGKLVAPVSGKFLPNENPSEAKVYSEVPDVDAAVIAAQKAFHGWSTMAVDERAAILQKVADLIDRDLDKLALAESIDNGKPVKLARTLDIPRASANVRFFATAALHTSTEAHLTGEEAVNYT